MIFAILWASSAFAASSSGRGHRRSAKTLPLPTTGLRLGSAAAWGDPRMWSPKPVVWLGDTLATLRACPQDVRDEVGHALYLAQIGEEYADCEASQKRRALRHLREGRRLSVERKMKVRIVYNPDAAVPLPPRVRYPVE